MATWLFEDAHSLNPARDHLACRSIACLDSALHPSAFLYLCSTCTGWCTNRSNDPLYYPDSKPNHIDKISDFIATNSPATSKLSKFDISKQIWSRMLLPNLKICWQLIGQRIPRRREGRTFSGTPASPWVSHNHDNSDCLCRITFSLLGVMVYLLRLLDMKRLTSCRYLQMIW